MRRCIVCNAPGGLDGWCGECCLPNVVAETDPGADAPPARAAAIVPLDDAGDAAARIDLPAAPASLLGRLLGGAPLGCSILVHGNPGAGKTSDALKFASELAAVVGGRSLLVSGEMPQRLALDVARRAGVDTSRLDVLLAIGGPLPVFDVGDRVAVVYDSANRLGADPVAVTARAIERARDEGHIAIVIAHTTNEGHAKGGTDLAHDVDAHVVIASRTRAAVKKARIDVRALDVDMRKVAPRGKARLRLVRDE